MRRIGDLLGALIGADEQMRVVLRERAHAKQAVQRAFELVAVVLAALKTDTTNIKGLSGIRVRARLYIDDDPTDLRDAWMDVVGPDTPV